VSSIFLRGEAVLGDVLLDVNEMPVRAVRLRANDKVEDLQNLSRLLTLYGMELHKAPGGPRVATALSDFWLDEYLPAREAVLKIWRGINNYPALPPVMGDAVLYYDGRGVICERPMMDAPFGAIYVKERPQRILVSNDVGMHRKAVTLGHEYVHRFDIGHGTNWAHEIVHELGGYANDEYAPAMEHARRKWR